MSTQFHASVPRNPRSKDTNTSRWSDRQRGFLPRGARVQGIGLLVGTITFALAIALAGCSSVLCESDNDNAAYPPCLSAKSDMLADLPPPPPDMAECGRAVDEPCCVADMGRCDPGLECEPRGGQYRCEPVPDMARCAAVGDPCCCAGGMCHCDGGFVCDTMTGFCGAPPPCGGPTEPCCTGPQPCQQLPPLLCCSGTCLTSCN